MSPPPMNDEADRLHDLALDVEDILRRHGAGLNKSERFVLHLAAFEIRETADALCESTLPPRDPNTIDWIDED